MNKVKIEKGKLLDQIEINRTEHKFIYEEAIIGWKKEVTEALTDALHDATEGISFDTKFDIEEPMHHLKEYDEILEMIRWHDEDYIELDKIEFNRYIRDNWEWMYGFLGNASTYSSSSSSSNSSSLISTKMSKLDY